MRAVADTPLPLIPSSLRVRTRPRALFAAEGGDADGAAADAHAGGATVSVSTERGRSPAAWLRRSTSAPAAAASASLQPLLPSAAAPASAFRGAGAAASEEDLYLFGMGRSVSSASLALSEDGGADDDTHAPLPYPWGSFDDVEAAACAPRAAGGALVLLPSPRSAPIAVQRPVRHSAPGGGGRGDAHYFSWHSRAHDAADALSGGAFMPPQRGASDSDGEQTRGEMDDDGGVDAMAGDGGERKKHAQFEAHVLSLPPLRTLALRDSILRRTGFIESPQQQPGASSLPTSCTGAEGLCQGAA